MRCFAAGFAFLSLAIGPGPMSAQAGPSREFDAEALIQELQSPFCPGLNLMSCPSPQAADLREELRSRIASGESQEALRVDLVRRFGQGVLGLPTWSGFDVLAWVTPGVALFVAAGLLVRRLRRERASRKFTKRRVITEPVVRPRWRFARPGPRGRARRSIARAACRSNQSGRSPGRRPFGTPAESPRPRHGRSQTSPRPARRNLGPGHRVPGRC